MKYNSCTLESGCLCCWATLPSCYHSDIQIHAKVKIKLAFIPTKQPFIYYSVGCINNPNQLPANQNTTNDQYTDPDAFSIDEVFLLI